MLPEKQFIEGLRKVVGKGARRNLVQGIGDDCAILHFRAGLQLLVTTDLCIEGVHFRQEWHHADSAGHRCLARGLSDIAAMGGEPVVCFLSLGTPSQLSAEWVDEFLRGLLRLARKFHMPLAGGDTSEAEKIMADIVVLGMVPAGEAVLRSGSRQGDCIYVTGDLGGSAAVVKSLFRKERIPAALARKHFYPAPRVEVGKWLRQKRIPTAMIDISDGLSVDLEHICTESQVSAVIDQAAIPVARGTTLDWALHGGEDYELLFTARPKTNVPAKIAGVAISRIGKIRGRSGGHFRVQIRDSGGRLKPLRAEGWQHFRRK